MIRRTARMNSKYVLYRENKSSRTVYDYAQGPDVEYIGALWFDGTCPIESKEILLLSNDTIGYRKFIISYSKRTYNNCLCKVISFFEKNIYFESKTLLE